jgi:formylglycine-generating enzyme required for sulfatase activity/cephalosporin-C deacetylase-like acetyl esterase/predicted Ser/Thr protein kinase
VVGRTIGHYRIVQELGRGGMGSVWQALDTHLNRLVAIKILTPRSATSPESRRRFTQEAQAASALNHPNIVTIHDIASEDGTDYIVMEFVSGRTLDKIVAGGPLSDSQALNYSLQISSALARAHHAGIIHRDIKPSNIMVDDQGLVKLLDFGLAKLFAPEVFDGPTETIGQTLTEKGHIVGTLAYMSPEQAQGRQLDARSDVFSFGAVLYEMLSGRRPFKSDSQLGVLMAIVRDTEPELRSVRTGITPEMAAVVKRCLAKSREERYASAEELHRALAALQQTISGGSLALGRQIRLAVRRPRYLVPALAVLVLAVGLVAWWGMRASRARWAEREAIPRIAALVGRGDYVAAFDLARQAQDALPGNDRLKALWSEVTRTVSVRTEPPGAEIYFKGYTEPDTAWRLAGTSPAKVEIPRGYFRWKMVKEGCLPLLELGVSAEDQQFRLSPRSEVPPGMVHVPATPKTAGGMPILGLGNLLLADLPAFWIDRTEVTNREFKKFVDAGGYKERKYWKHPIQRGKEALQREDAMQLFRDSTGRPGPAVWEGGTFPPDQGDYPVRGVSWYEAAAYAEYAGKQLPTIYHWYRAADPRTATFVMQSSNFNTAGPAPAGQCQARGPFETLDMAGNVKEWCFNQSNADSRFILGGAWHDAVYLFYQADAQPALSRHPSNGFRCVRASGPAPERIFAAVNKRDEMTRSTLVTDAAFQAYLRLYAYESGDLKAAVEKVDDSNPDWARETVTFAAAYGGERVIGHLLRPKHGKPPYQTVVYFPGAGVQRMATSQFLDGVNKWDFIVRGGRAVFHPVIRGTYERQKPPPQNPLQTMSALVERVQDIQRSVDYLITRPDIDHQRLAYAGSSWGAASGAWVLAVDRRFKAAVLMDGGLYTVPALSEYDQANYAPRAKTPVLMLNGRYDFFFPVETSQKPMFKLFGAAAADKRHVLYESTHDISLFRQQMMREALDWLDKYLGPVAR